MADLSNEQQMRRIEDYWLRLGYRIEIAVVAGKPYTLPSGIRVTPHVVRSDMVGGLPPGCPSRAVPGRR